LKCCQNEAKTDGRISSAAAKSQAQRGELQRKHNYPLDSQILKIITTTATHLSKTAAIFLFFKHAILLLSNTENFAQLHFTVTGKFFCMTNIAVDLSRRFLHKYFHRGR